MLHQRKFRPSLVPTLSFLVLLPLLLYLGSWQLQRAEEKRELQAEYDARGNGPAIAVETHPQRADELQFYRISAKGYYENEHQVLLDNRVHQGQAGYEVITPFRLLNSDMRLLVNRGWVPLGDDRGHLPVIDPPKELQEVVGVATVPADKYFMLASPEALDHGWQRVWQHMDMARYRAAVTFPVQPVVVLLDPASPAGGFTRDWSRLDAGIAVHKGYAFQWFMLAAALVVIYLFMSLRGARDTKQEEEKL